MTKSRRARTPLRPIASSPRPPGSFSSRVVWLSLALAALDLAVFAQIRQHAFITYDDPLYVTGNPQVLGGLTARGVAWAFTTGHSANWHPVTWLSHMLDVELFGLEAGAHHVTSFALHLANTLLLFWGLHRMTGATGRSAFVAALFGVHPLHVESVAWIAERKDVLSTLFWWLTIWAYVAFVRRPDRRRYGLVLLSFALGLASKPMLVTLPFTLLLIDVWPLGRLTGPPGRLRALVFEKVPLVVLAIASSLVTFLVQRQGGAVNGLDEIPVGLRVSNALVSYVGYLGKTIWPDRLAIFYPYPASIPVWATAGAVAMLVVISIAAFWLARRRPYVAIGWVWYLGTLLPVIGLIQVGGQALADRYTYVPLVGIFVIIAWGVPDLLARWPAWRALAPVAAATVILACAVTARAQTAHWRTSFALWQHAVEVTRDNHVAEDALGTILVEMGQPAEAIPHLSRAVAIKPTFAQAHYNLGLAFTKEGRDAEAAAQYVDALRLLPDLAEAHYNLGVILARQGQFDAAAREFREVLRINPQNTDAQRALDALPKRGE
jgi:hypothetical protein